MSDEKGTVYRVMVEAERVEGQAGTDLLVLGDQRAHNPKTAIDLVVNDRGLPNVEGGTMVAVPIGNWHAFPVRGRQATIYDVGEKLDPNGEQTTLAEPVPEED